MEARRSTADWKPVRWECLLNLPLALGRANHFARRFEVFAGESAAAGVLLMMGPDFLGPLVDEHAAALVLYARQWCAAPEDVVQEAFVKLTALNRPPANPVSWLYRVVRNAAISAGRSERRRRHHEAVVAARTPAWFTSAENAGLDATTAAAALQALPAEQREAIVAHL